MHLADHDREVGQESRFAQNFSSCTSWPPRAASRPSAPSDALAGTYFEFESTDRRWLMLLRPPSDQLGARQIVTKVHISLLQRRHAAASTRIQTDRCCCSLRNTFSACSIIGPSSRTYVHLPQASRVYLRYKVTRTLILLYGMRGSSLARAADQQISF